MLYRIDALACQDEALSEVLLLLPPLISLLVSCLLWLNPRSPTQAHTKKLKENILFKHDLELVVEGRAQSCHQLTSHPPQNLAQYDGVDCG